MGCYAQVCIILTNKVPVLLDINPERFLYVYSYMPIHPFVLKIKNLNSHDKKYGSPWVIKKYIVPKYNHKSDCNHARKM